MKSKKPQVSDNGILEMFTWIFTLTSVLLLLLKKPSSLGKMRLLNSSICSPQLPPKSFLKPNANPVCLRCLGSLKTVNLLSKNGKKHNVLFFGNQHQKTFSNLNNFERKLVTMWIMLNETVGDSFCNNFVPRQSWALWPLLYSWYVTPFVSVVCGHGISLVLALPRVREWSSSQFGETQPRVQKHSKTALKIAANDRWCYRRTSGR